MDRLQPSQPHRMLGSGLPAMGGRPGVYARAESGCASFRLVSHTRRVPAVNEDIPATR